MASNTRGKLKENFEGVHRNFDWVIYHCNKSLAIIAEHKPELSNAIIRLTEAVKTLDGLAEGIYKRL